MSDRTCTTDGCSKPHRARGFCSTHYNRRVQTDRHKRRILPCAWCRKDVETFPRAGAKYGVVCSTMCRTHLQHLARSGGERSDSTDLVVRRPQQNATAKQRSRKTPVPRRKFTWYSGACALCSANFVTGRQCRTCSSACARAIRVHMLSAKAHRYRSRMRDAFVADVDPLSIYERDGWRCHVCNKEIDKRARRTPLAPSLDHVIPLANGGTHEPSNVWACHLGCNSLRGNTPILITRTGERVAVLF